jgi:hypothetical protein
MNGLIRKAGLLMLGALSVAGMANAGVPSSTFSTQPAGFLLVGYWNPPDPIGVFTYTIRDANNTLVGAGVEVILNFSACTDVRLCGDNIGPPTNGHSTSVPPPIVVDEAAKTVKASTNASSQVTFTIVGGGNIPLGGGPGNGTPRAGPYTPAGQACVTVTAGGQPMLARNAAALDLNSVGGSNGPDLTAWLTDFGAYAGGAGPFYGRSDFNLSNAIDGPDLTLYLTAFGLAAGGAGTGTVLSCADVSIP